MVWRPHVPHQNTLIFSNDLPIDSTFFLIHAAGAAAAAMFDFFLFSVETCSLQNTPSLFYCTVAHFSHSAMRIGSNHFLQ